ATVQAVLAARIDRLPPPIKHLLQSAAVIGKTVALTLLETVAETTALELRRGLAQLQAAEFLYETSLFPELEYTFKHALTLEVAYQSLLRERRRLLHAAVLRALEARGREHAPENIEVLAHHAVRGELWSSAAAHLYRARAGARGRRPRRCLGPPHAELRAIHRRRGLPGHRPHRGRDRGVQHRGEADHGRRGQNSGTRARLSDLGESLRVEIGSRGESWA